ncbi:right-handed parallel beta-helix repeat-containing protein [Ruficoccus amylovorans]|uniref:Right-handed parallel beta-helix repeat-containing protein n=1 Tax=Ruficoccus amylovorans TaxID=1804625 RepID=A0A842H9Q4_9BACT|nr:right-handed parallel beta-helix repeat-containing protein [Ruficoccus amylovorans]MBC2593223.1 right-handed parallel beta-helix repeat-containing protein [Ruficoccus amylovorans]
MNKVIRSSFIFSVLSLFVFLGDELGAENSPSNDVPPGAGAILEPLADGGDATALIQNALREHGIVRLRDGAEFHLQSPIRLTSGQGLVGSAVLIPEFESKEINANLSAAIVIHGKNVLLDGLEIRKPFVDGSYGIGVMVSSGSENITLRNLEISRYSARYGILVLESSSIEITGCTIRDFMMNVAADMISDSPAGICIKRCNNGIVSNNRVFRIKNGPAGRASISPLKPQYGKQGYQSDNIFIGSSTGFAVTGNVLETSGEGIDLLLSSSCTVTGNVIRDIWFQGIKMLGASNCTISGNYISDCYQGIGLATHRTYDAECENNSITGNVIRNTGTPGSFGVAAPGRVRYGETAGIDINDTSKNNVIANNVIAITSPDAEMTSAIRKNDEYNLIKNNILPDEKEAQ